MCPSTWYVYHHSIALNCWGCTAQFTGWMTRLNLVSNFCSAQFYTNMWHIFIIWMILLALSQHGSALNSKQQKLFLHSLLFDKWVKLLQLVRESNQCVQCSNLTKEKKTSTIRQYHSVAYTILSACTHAIQGVRKVQRNTELKLDLASSPASSQILLRSRGEKSSEGLGTKLRHGPEMVDLVST